MPQVPDAAAIAQQVKARIKHVEEQLKQHHKLTDELERLRDALSRLEGEARSRVSAVRRTGKPTATPAGNARGPAPRSPRACRLARRAVRTRPSCSTRSRMDR